MAFMRSGVRSPSAPPKLTNDFGHPRWMPFVFSLTFTQPDAIRACELAELSELATRWVQALVQAPASESPRDLNLVTGLATAWP